MTEHRPTTEYFAELAKEVQRMAERETDGTRARVLAELAQRIERDQSLTYDAMTVAAGFAELSLHYRLDQFAKDIDELGALLAESKADRTYIKEQLEQFATEIAELRDLLDESRDDRTSIKAQLSKMDHETQGRIGELEQSIGQVLGLLRESNGEGADDPA